MVGVGVARVKLLRCCETEGGRAAQKVAHLANHLHQTFAVVSCQPCAMPPENWAFVARVDLCDGHVAHVRKKKNFSKY